MRVDPIAPQFIEEREIAGPRTLSQRQVAVLRETLHQAAAHTQCVRWGVLLLVLAAVTWFVYGGGPEHHFHSDGHSSVEDLVYFWQAVPRLISSLFCGALLGLIAALPAGWGYRHWRSHAIRREIEGVPRLHQREVLSPLCHAEGDSGKIADRLIRDIGLHRISGEVVPAARPDGAGSEISPSA